MLTKLEIKGKDLREIINAQISPVFKISTTASAGLRIRGIKKPEKQLI
nr:hypothetical protein P5665_21975 [Bacillus subtilis]